MELTKELTRAQWVQARIQNYAYKLGISTEEALGKSLKIICLGENVVAEFDSVCDPAFHSSNKPKQ